MPQSVYQQLLHRDGTSQAERVQMALSPAYVSVNERSLKDLLAFAREYAKELRYWDAENRSANESWSAFLSPDLDLDEVVAFVQDPEKVPAEKARLYSRPHFVLFLSFLQLLSHAQEYLNTLTRRHLDFYYQQVLRLAKRPGTPDRVNVLVGLASDIERFELPAGTLLNAGTDSLGQDLVYRTDRDVVVNQARIARLCSVYADKRVIGIREAREEYEGPKNEAVVEMLRIALGEPLPGDPLPAYETGEVVDYDFLLLLHRLVRFVPDGLCMGFSEFRTLMQLKQQRDGSDAQWQEINQLLEKAGRQRTGSSDFVLGPSDPRDFDANLEAAVGGAPNFDGLTEVEDIYDLYDQRIRQDVQQTIRERLYFEDVNDFVRMMQIKVRIDNEWGEINRILEQAGRQKGTLADALPEDTGPPVFDDKLEAALGALDYASLPGNVTNLDDYYAAFLRVEAYFFTSARNFAYLVSVAEKPEATPQEWGRVYDDLADAYQAKFYAGRRDRLRQVRELQGFDAMIAFALGEDGTRADTALERFLEYVKDPEDAAFLEEVSQRTDDVSDAEWDRVYRVVERAQRVREDLGEPVAQKEEWLNLYPAEDATTVRATFGIEADQDNPRWRTFGQGQVSVDRDSLPPVSFGWAICSPLLTLSQGKRTVTLTLGFRGDAFDAEKIRALFPDASGSSAQDEGPLLIEVSTEKGWIEPDTLAVEVADYPSLAGVSDPDAETLQAIRFVLAFAENADALAPAGEADIDTPWPVLRVMLRQVWEPDNPQGETGRYITHYLPFKNLVLARTQLAVDVSGLGEFLAENDDTTLDATKPFEPFGSSPSAGSRFFLGHPEIVYNKLDSLKFHLQWMGAPRDLGAYYRTFGNVAHGDGADSLISNASFTVSIHLVDRRVYTLLAEREALFDTARADVAHTIGISDLPYGQETDRVLGDDLKAWNRYLQWELNAPDFQHLAYPMVASNQSVALAAAITNKKEGDPDIVAADYQVNPPYTPKIKSLSLDYTASTELVVEGDRLHAQSDRMFHIHPFGYHEIQPNARTGEYLFLPLYDYEGELYIGVEDAQPPQNLSFLFQMAEGSADPDLEPVPVEWSYLSGNRWVSLDDGNVLLDTTRGLINSGIVVLDLQKVRPSTRVSPGLYWLRAAIPRHSNSVCDTVAIHTQAVSATFEDRDNAPDHLDRPLPAGSISDLAEPLPEVAGIRQPYTSYGGKMAELDRMFYTRISERLRHKQRALSPWDYEHLILERFPQIYKAKCLPADPATHPDGVGRVEIVVIPDIRNKLPFNPFEPKAPADLIADIEAYLADHTPTFATVKVKNAYYVPVKVRFAVRFLPGYNEGYYRQRLNEELNRFLSPWAYEDGAEIVIGRRIYANILVNFIEERPYVDYVAEVKLFSCEDGRNFRLALPSPSEGYWVQTDRPDGVLVAAQEHEIDMIPEAGYEEESFVGIEYMKIELDFVVG